MRNAVGVSRVVGACDIIEIDKRIVPDCVTVPIGQWNECAVDVLMVSFPGYTGVFQECDKMIGRVLVVCVGIIVVQNAKVGTGFEPEIVRKTGMEIGHIVVTFATRCHGQQCGVQVGSVSAPFHFCPGLVFQEDDENGLDRRDRSRIQSGQIEQQNYG